MTATEAVSATDRPDSTRVLEARNVSMQYGGPKGLFAAKDVSFSVRPGSTLALVGESGSGKSTMAQILAQLLVPTSGEVLLAGKPVQVRSGRHRRAFAHEVQLLLQDPFSAFNPLHRVQYSLERAIRLHRPGRMSKKAVTEVAHELLTRVRLTPPELFLEKYPHELSGGQLQRIAIARSLAARPKILLLDEPVSMLDVSIRFGILNLLSALKTEQNLGLLYITHDIASGRYFSDNMIVMYHGEIVEAGPSEELTQHPVHPYTQLLITSSPDPTRTRDRSAPTRGSRAAGKGFPACPFADRCDHAMDICRTTAPPKVPAAGTDHWARCWLPSPELPRRTGAAGTGGVTAGGS